MKDDSTLGCFICENARKYYMFLEYKVIFQHYYCYKDVDMIILFYQIHNRIKLFPISYLKSSLLIVSFTDRV